MSGFIAGDKPTPGLARPIRFACAREACRYLLRSSIRSGRFFPRTPAELLPLIQQESFLVTRADVEALLADLARDGEALEIDADAGYRWTEPAA